MQNPINILLATITDTHSYIYLGNKPFKQAIGYALSMLAIISLVHVLILSTNKLPQQLAFAISAMQDIINTLPQSLALHIESGHLTPKGLDEPLFIPLSQPSEVITHALVINEEAVGEAVKEYQSIVLLTGKSFSVTLDTNNQTTRIFPWADIAPDANITAQQIVTQLQSTVALLERIRPYLIPITFMVTFFTLLALRLMFLLLHSALITLSLSLTGKQVPYSLAFKLGLYTLIVTEIIWLAAQIIYQNAPGFLYTLAFYAITLAAFSPLAIRHSRSA